MSKSKGKAKDTGSVSDTEPAQKKEFELYNSMTKQKEKFKPKEDGKVRMYVCGVTAYDFSHIGHARAYVAFDVLYRYLKYLGYEVVYVRNFTDVDDKIIKRANEHGEDPIALSSRFCDEFLRDMDDLQCLPPTHQPRVSDHIEQIKEMIEQIIRNGCAYTVDGDVYFSIDSFPNYGRLSSQNVEGNRAGERVAVDPRKRNPADFALWKAAKPDEPIWDSPWGPGRPGWHIECSAMSALYLTHSFDIHGGGMDLTFPHHENELAQSCAACPDSDITYWVHNGFVTIDDKKMSKSLGNFFTIRKVTQHYHPLALRLFLLGMHYRSPVNYSLQQLDNASESLFYIYQTLKDGEDALKGEEDTLNDFQEKETKGTKTPIDNEIEKCISKLHDEFEEKMADDLHASPVLNDSLMDALRSINKSLEKLKKKMQKQQKSLLLRSLSKLLIEVCGVLNVFGLLPSRGYSEALLELKSKALVRAELSEDEVLRIIEERKEARRSKDYSRGDQIRKSLAAKGIALMDVGVETVWRPCVPVPIEDDDREKKEVLGVSVQQGQTVVPAEQIQPARKARVDAVWQQMNKGISQKTMKSILNKPSVNIKKSSQKSSPKNWMTVLNLAPKKTHVVDQCPIVSHSKVTLSDDTKRVASAALLAVKDAVVSAVASGRGKMEVTEVRDFAGEEIEVKKLVDASPKETSEKEKAPVGSTSAVDAVLEQIKKKSKLSVLDKTKKDWGEFKEENKGLEDELDAYKKSSNQYLDKVSFLQRTDYREFERERDARLALQAKRKADMREDF